MTTMNYEDYVKRITTKGMRWRAIDQSEDMKRYIRAQVVVQSGGRKITRSEGQLDKKVLITVESMPERPLDLPKIEDLPEELRDVLKKIGSKVENQLAKLAKQKLPAKFLAVEMHPDDLDRNDPRMNVAGRFSADVIGRKLFLSVPDQPDHWRMRHEENRDAWIEFEFLGAIDMSGFEDDEPDEASKDVANDLFARLGNDAPKH